MTMPRWLNKLCLRRMPRRGCWPSCHVHPSILHGSECSLSAHRHRHYKARAMWASRQTGLVSIELHLVARYCCRPLQLNSLKYSHEKTCMLACRYQTNTECKTLDCRTAVILSCMQFLASASLTVYNATKKKSEQKPKRRVHESGKESGDFFSASAKAALPFFLDPIFLLFFSLNLNFVRMICPMAMSWSGGSGDSRMGFAMRLML